jgi:hypothetical protein
LVEPCCAMSVIQCRFQGEPVRTEYGCFGSPRKLHEFHLAQL